jgi:hypothetical protein
MCIRNLFILCIAVSIVVSCGSSKNKKAKRIAQTKMQIVTTKTAFDPEALKIVCDSVNFEIMGNDLKSQKLVIFNGILPIDTLIITKLKLEPGIENAIIKADLDFDGNCEFIIPDKKTTRSGSIKHYYFIYDTATKNYVENTTLPSYFSDFKLDIKNQRVKLYCPKEDCFAYFKYNAEKKFELVQGEFKSID